jgi:hypothetical protein
MPSQPGTEGRLFRASPAFELVVWDRLADDERRLLGELAARESFYGILRPRAGSARALRAVDRDTALLLLTLQEAAPLPGFARAGGDASIAELVTDGVLEVSDGDRFLTGGAGAALLLTGTARESKHRLGRLSGEALRYGASLRLRDPQPLAARLYAYNRVPLTPAWARRLPDAPAILRFLDVPHAGGWQIGSSAGGSWIQWSRQSRHAGPPTHKLYVSPLPDALPDAFRRTLEVLERSPVAQFKVGGDAPGVLRPDKLVIYFADAATLAAVADDLGRALAGVPAQGVPFTAPIDEDGLLSWGMDPPPEARPLSWLPSESWRSWLVRELASALLPAGDTPAPVHPSLERLRRRGVDVERWVPTSSVWRELER